jgi:hypothetical protein
MPTEQISRLGGWVLSRSGLICLGFPAIVAFFLWTEHRAHLLGILPYALLLLCPILHYLMHGRHGGHGNSGKGEL